MVYRYDISYQEIGLTATSFVAQLLEQGHVSHSSDELSEDQNRHLSGWIRGLFNPEGISDEVMSSCRPQEFYMLVPTLISQTVFACTAEVLGKDSMKGGLECESPIHLSYETSTDPSQIFLKRSSFPRWLVLSTG
jgi:mediator of RNA polymerase II transcription subunit 5